MDYAVVPAAASSAGGGEGGAVRGCQANAAAVGGTAAPRACVRYASHAVHSSFRVAVEPALALHMGCHGVRVGMGVTGLSFDSVEGR